MKQHPQHRLGIRYHNYQNTRRRRHSNWIHSHAMYLAGLLILFALIGLLSTL